MRTIKLALAFLFVFAIGISVNTVSVSNSGFSIESSTAEAAQSTTTSSKPIKTGNLNSPKPDFGLVVDKSPIENFLQSHEKLIRGGLLVFCFLAGLLYMVYFGLELKQRADEGSVKHPASKLIATALAATVIMNFYRALGWFVPSGDNCTQSGFMSGECGKTPMPVTGALADELMGSASAASNNATGGNLSFLGDTFSVVNSVSYLVMAIGAVYFVCVVMLMRKMYSDPQTKKDVGLLARTAMASVIVINHRSLIELAAGSLKLMGFGA